MIVPNQAAPPRPVRPANRPRGWSNTDSQLFQALDAPTVLASARRTITEHPAAALGVAAAAGLLLGWWVKR